MLFSMKLNTKNVCILRVKYLKMVTMVILSNHCKNPCFFCGMIFNAIFLLSVMCRNFWVLIVLISELCFLLTRYNMHCK